MEQRPAIAFYPAAGRRLPLSALAAGCAGRASRPSSAGLPEAMPQDASLRSTRRIAGRPPPPALVPQTAARIRTGGDSRRTGGAGSVASMPIGSDGDGGRPLHRLWRDNRGAALWSACPRARRKTSPRALAARAPRMACGSPSRRSSALVVKGYSPRPAESRSAENGGAAVHLWDIFMQAAAAHRVEGCHRKRTGATWRRLPAERGPESPPGLWASSCVPG
jgi:hypothetical protein